MVAWSGTGTERQCVLHRDILRVLVYAPLGANEPGTCGYIDEGTDDRHKGR